METSSGWTFKAIVDDGDNWAECQRQYKGQLSEHQIAEVEKMLKCGKAENGYATYICVECGERKRVCFSCKSRVCSSCGKVHSDEWAKDVSGRLFNVTHRHITFTVPEELWPVLEENAEWRKELFGAAHRTLSKVIKHESGMVMVLHPYGKDLKVNYHIHVLVTEGGLDEAGIWQAQPYVNYAALRKIWQYEVLTGLRQVMPQLTANRQLVDKLFRKYPNGFYVHAEPRVENGKGISRYIGRYIRHPAIADARIVAYDGERVTFYYEDRRQGRQERTLPVVEFIYSVVRHIPPRQFKMVRYFGLYAPRKAGLVRTIMEQIGKAVGRVVRRLSWRERIQQTFHHDPLTCPRCGTADMELFSLTLPWRGQMITIGGWEWLFERGCIQESPQDPVPPPAEPHGIQLALGF